MAIFVLKGNYPIQSKSNGSYCPTNYSSKPTDDYMNVRFYNRLKEEDDFEKQFSFYSDFDANAQLTGGVLDAALEEILERIIQDIFNASIKMVIGVKTYTTLLSHPELVKDEQVSDLRSIIKKFPYFQSARALYLRSLKNQDSFRYNNELKITAAYTTDRSVLFDFITSSQTEPRENIHQQISTMILEEIPVIAEDVIEEARNELNMVKPIRFTSREVYSFNEWLQLSAKKPIAREKEKSLSKSDIIDQFIKNNPKFPTRKGEKWW